MLSARRSFSTVRVHDCLGQPGGRLQWLGNGGVRVYPYPRVCTGRCLTGRVGYGYEVHGSGIPVFTRKEHHFSRCWSYIECFFLFLPFSERELTFTFAICRRRRLSVCLSVVCNVRAPYSGDEIVGKVSTPFNTVAVR